MSSDLLQYKEALQNEIKALQEKVSHLEEEIIQVKLKFELRKNDLRDEAARELADYQPNSMGLKFEINVEDINAGKDDVTKVLNKMFKI